MELSFPKLCVNKGITLTQPVIGRIAMGRAVTDENGSSFVMNDYFSLTTLVQDNACAWEEHPLQKILLAEKKGKAKDRLRAIPVRIAYNDPNLTLHNSFVAWENGRVLCCGNGTTARRLTNDGVMGVDCPRPEGCVFGAHYECKNMSRVYFQIDGQDDELGVFVLRTSSLYALKYIGSRLAQLAGLTGGRLAGMPMMLVMRPKTKTTDLREEFQFADLVTRPGMTLNNAIKQANDFQKAMADMGLSIAGMEEALRNGLTNSDFAEVDLDDVTDDALPFVSERQSARRGLRGMDNLLAHTGQIADNAHIENGESLQQGLFAVDVSFPRNLVCQG